MSYTLFCDICGVPIKEKEEKYVVGINKVIQEEDNFNKLYGAEDPMNDLSNLIDRSRNKSQVKLYEICPKCKKVLDYFINLRIKKVKKIQRLLEDYE